MTDLPRKFEFDCKPFGKGQLYVANLDVKDEYGYVEIKYSPNFFASMLFPVDEVFWIETEKDFASLINSGIRRITEIYAEAVTPPNIDDLI